MSRSVTTGPELPDEVRKAVLGVRRRWAFQLEDGRRGSPVVRVRPYGHLIRAQPSLSEAVALARAFEMVDALAWLNFLATWRPTDSAAEDEGDEERARRDRWAGQAARLRDELVRRAKPEAIEYAAALVLRAVHTELEALVARVGYLEYRAGGLLVDQAVLARRQAVSALAATRARAHGHERARDFAERAALRVVADPILVCACGRLFRATSARGRKPRTFCDRCRVMNSAQRDAADRARQAAYRAGREELVDDFDAARQPVTVWAGICKCGRPFEKRRADGARCSRCTRRAGWVASPLLGGV